MAGPMGATNNEPLDIRKLVRSKSKTANDAIFVALKAAHKEKKKEEGH
jgi:hypothetical protein